MKLHQNWRALLRRAWSVRLSLVATALSGLEVTIGPETEEIFDEPIEFA